ncbi:hypothetical protein AR457_37245 [Streptomyces agglomeratus]|uniref:Uncharacterized protein n=1 Tax=Streptomyces agglomeratus TaxID=285458 RepID=A0A1E5NYQ9_9ACTN|nr:hypothetical protein [Streptomyces agglomeratus]OEJ21452.1 hypothetical protein AS594_38475 [Streptomyces agglomeratus]OEJ22885.1 hypothetical protein AR457_37245 [Streptomyces agglomeratus]OEJ36461.1 hypothetical protein BGK72_37730 [Streptomyces agglomeratus]OEJ56524.1 hypothetical protein BGM19_38360 [Streptomyces agglomeratus]
MRGVGNLCIGAASEPPTTHVDWSNSSSQDYADRMIDAVSTEILGTAASSVLLLGRLVATAQ